MPGDFHYLEDSKIFITVYWGRVSLVDILDTILRRAHDPDLHVAKANVIDLSRATWLETPPSYLHEELNRLRPALAPPKVHTVFVAPGDFFYGLARMYAIVHVIYGMARVDVVRSWPDAARIVERDLTDAEAWAERRAGADDKTGTIAG